MVDDLDQRARSAVLEYLKNNPNIRESANSLAVKTNTIDVLSVGRVLNELVEQRRLQRSEPETGGEFVYFGYKA